MTAASNRFLRRNGCVLAFLWLLGSGRAETNSSPTLEHLWPQWRGPHANEVAPFANPPTHWSETENIRWKVALPGKGHSSPIVLSNAVYVLAAAPAGPEQGPVYDTAPGVHDSIPVTHRHQYLALALSRSNGRTLWQTLLREEFPHEGGHVTGSPLSNSPISDGESIFAFLGSRGLYALNLKGEIQWQKDLGKMLTLHAHGEGSSPAIYRDTLVVNWDHEGDDFIVAFDKQTGQELWRQPRDEETSWATPLSVSSAIRNAENRLAEPGIGRGKLLRQLPLRACVHRLAARAGDF